jgi:hypothetical protein
MLPARLKWIWRLLFVACLAAALVFAARGRWLVGAAWLVATIVPIALLLPRGRRGWFALAAIAFSALMAVSAVAGLDLYLHHRFARNGGYNIWGYRGPTLGARQPGERRIAMLGGSVAFGFGVLSDETIPYYVEQRLEHAPGAARTRVINLGWNSEGAHAFLPTLADYDYLDYSTVILYSGYNDLGFNNQVFRHESAIFRMTGYLPILPIIPIRGWLHLDNLSDTSRDGRVIFRPTLSDDYAAEAADTALRISQALERELAQLAPAAAPAARAADQGCDGEWKRYCEAVLDATNYAVARGKQVFIVSEPNKKGRHVPQQAAIRAMVDKTFAGNAVVRYIDMRQSVNLDDRRLCFDGLHLTAAGNAQVAAALAPLLLESIRPVPK